MIVLVDNYDSFSYNLFQLMGSLVSCEVRVVRNDCITWEEAAAARAIVLSPGPGRPADAGECEEVVTRLGATVPLLGVCLGHQAIVEACGGGITYARELMHGKSSMCETVSDSVLFAGLTSPLQVGRYHSLAADATHLPASLRVTARTADGEVMAVEHKSQPTFGVQFHPESIMTPDGRKIVENFLNEAQAFNERTRR